MPFSGCELTTLGLVKCPSCVENYKKVETAPPEPTEIHRGNLPDTDAKDSRLHYLEVEMPRDAKVPFLRNEILSAELR